jgi:3-oxoacid CoA-transferase subunit B
MSTQVAPTGRERIVARASLEITDGMNVNLGIGLPTLLADIAADRRNVMLQSENGLLGIGPYPKAGEADADVINAGKETVTAIPGASYCSSADAFAMIRGGHMDLAILGGMEVSETGDLANWMVPGKMIKGMGGAMDLVAGAKRVVVIMEHLTKAGESRVRHRCTLPLTGVGVVDRLITDLAVFDFGPNEPVLVELQDGVTIAEVEAATEAHFTVAPELIR